MNSMHRIAYLPLIILFASATGCGCLIGGGGDTARADRLDYAHKEMGIGVGGPGWWMLKHLGAHFVEVETPVAAMAIRGVKRVQVSRYTLHEPSQAHRDEIFGLYAALMRKKGWHLISRTHEDQHTSCVYAQYDEDSFRGVFVVAIEGAEMNVIRIVGDIRPEAFAPLNVHLGQYGARLPVPKSVFEN